MHVAEAKEDEINYSDDDATAAVAVPKPAETVTESKTEAASAEVDGAAVTEAQTDDAPKEPAPLFTLGLASTAADDEAKRRADRAKRFGIEEDNDAKKKTDRAARFGVDENDIASSLDSALPERPLKRGRGRGLEGDNNNRPGKRQSLDRRGDRRRGGGGGGGGNNNSRGGRDDAAPAKKVGNIVDDPVEKAKAEKRAARFATA